MSSTPGKDISYADARAIHAVVAEDAATPRLASHIKVPRFSTVAPRPGSQAPRFATTPPRAPIPTITPDPDPEEEEEESFDDEEDAAKGMWLSNESSGRPKNPLLEKLYKNQVSVSQSPRPRGFMSTNRSPRSKNTGQQHHYNIQKIGVGASRTYSDKRMQHRKENEAAAKIKILPKNESSDDQEAAEKVLATEKYQKILNRFNEQMQALQQAVDWKVEQFKKEGNNDLVLSIHEEAEHKADVFRIKAFKTIFSCWPEYFKKYLEHLHKAQKQRFPPGAPDSYYRDSDPVWSAIFQRGIISCISKTLREAFMDIIYAPAYNN